MSFLRKWLKKGKPVSPEPSRTWLSFREAVAKAGLLEFQDELESQILRSIFVTTVRGIAATKEVGRSRVGGLPDLPHGVAWPQVDGKSLGFVAQFNLSELRPFDKDGLLPSTGFLFFFYDAEQSAWGFDPKDKDHWRVIFYPGSSADLARVSLREDLSHLYFPECGVQFSSQATLPADLSAGWAIDHEKYSGLRQYLGAHDTHHQLLGHEDPVQGDVKLECQLVSHGLYCGDASGYKDPRAKQLQDGVADWLLLLQVDSDDNCNMMWGDLGKLYFCIRRQDLRQLRFDKVWMIFQCY